MNIEEFREFCLAQKGVTECFPFDEYTLVMKVGDKIFALAALEGNFSINLKSDPEIAVNLREEYSDVRPGYHMSKKHWNTIDITGSISDKLIYQWITDSYNLVFKSLPKKIQQLILEEG